MAAETVRPYRPADRNAIEAVMRRALADADAYFPDIPDEDGDPTLHAEFYAGDGGALLVVESADAEIIGTVGMRRPAGRLQERYDDFPPTVGELKRMHVLPAWQRSGVGAQLLDAIADRARMAGYREFVFSTTSRQSAAHAFYAENGFTRFDRERVELPSATFELYYYRGPIPGTQ